MNTLKASIKSHLKTAALPVLLALTPLSGFAHDAATEGSTTANINLPNAWTNILSRSVFYPATITIVQWSAVLIIGIKADLEPMNLVSVWMPVSLLQG